MAEKNFKIEKVEMLPDSEATISGEIALDYLNSCRKDALKHLNEHVNLPGFRKGMVPEDILVKNVGEMAVLEEAAEIAMGRAYKDIILESKLAPITRPQISITKMAPGIPLEFKINLILEPEYSLPNYRQIASEVKEDDTEKRRLQILEKIIEATKVEVPKKLVEMEARHSLHHFKHDAEKAGIKWEDYLNKTKKTDEEILESFKQSVINNFKAEFIIGKIAEKENLKTYKEVFEFLEKTT